MNKKAVILGTTLGIILAVYVIPRIINVLNNYIDLAHPSLNERIILLSLSIIVACLSYLCLRIGLSKRHNRHNSKHYNPNETEYCQTERAKDQIHKSIVCQDQSNDSQKDTQKYPCDLSPKITHRKHPLRYLSLLYTCLHLRATTLEQNP